MSSDSNTTINWQDAEHFEKEVNRMRIGQVPWEQFGEYYKYISESYDKFASERYIYRGPEIVAERVSKYFKDGRDIKILDAAAGTGLVAEALLKLGYTNVDALELSEDMLNKAKEKNLYRNYFLEGLSEKPTSIPDDVYDCFTMCGGFYGGTVPCCALMEAVRVVKPGGLVINIMNDSNLTVQAEYRDRLEPFMREITEKGKWRQLEQGFVPNYELNHSGFLSVFEVREAGVTYFTSAVL